MKIVLTGGGTAGHVIPHMALIPELRQRECELHYIGTEEGIEKQLVADLMPYSGISAGKLRRYVSWQNLTDPLRVVKGFGQSVGVLRRVAPDIVFSKGGFVAVPVVMAARLCRIPVVVHESDISPGLANRLAAPFAAHICVTFPETLQTLGTSRATLTGTPIRQELLNGDRARGLRFLEADGTRPILLFMGGSLGAASINQCVARGLSQLLQEFFVVHITGKGQAGAALGAADYRRYEFLTTELPDLLHAADLVVSRAGSNSIHELLALRKPHVLVPLSRKASRGDQVLNAASFASQGFCEVIQDEELTPEALLQALHTVWNDRAEYQQAMKAADQRDAVNSIIDIIMQTGSSAQA